MTSDWFWSSCNANYITKMCTMCLLTLVVFFLTPVRECLLASASLCNGWLVLKSIGASWPGPSYRCLCYLVDLWLSFSDPGGRLGMSDVNSLFGISGLSFDSPFLTHVFLSFFFVSFFSLSFLSFLLILLFFLPGYFSANGPFSWLFSSRKLKYFSLRVRLFVWLLVSS